MAELKKVHVTVVIEFFQKSDESDDEMLNIVKEAVEHNVGYVSEISKVKTAEEKKEEQKRRKQEWMKKYREQRKGQDYQKLKEGRKNNPEKVKAQRARYREKRKNRMLNG